MMTNTALACAGDWMEVTLREIGVRIDLKERNAFSEELGWLLLCRCRTLLGCRYLCRAEGALLYLFYVS